MMGWRLRSNLNQALRFATDYRLSAMKLLSPVFKRGSDTMAAGAWSARLALPTQLFALRPALAFIGLDRLADAHEFLFII